MSTLKSTIEDLASEFAFSIIGALRAASIDEITQVIGNGDRGGRAAGAGARGTRAIVESALSSVKRTSGRTTGSKRLGRRSVADIGRMVDSIVGVLESHPEGMRAEQIREALGCQAKELPRPLADGLADGRLRKTGQKRATTYFGGGAGGGAKRRGKAKR